MSEERDDAIGCRECGGAFVSHSGEGSTLLGFASPPGHNHDDNCLVRVYQCASGHDTALSVRRRCESCDWVGKTGCFCHQGQKVSKWPDAPFVTPEWMKKLEVNRALGVRIESA